MKPAVYVTWVLVCDAGHARIFAVGDPGTPWSLVQEIENPRGRLRTHDLVTDRPGRVQESAAQGRRSAMEPDTDPKEVEAHHFATELATALERALQEGAYSRLLVAAPPHFLGLLRARMGEQVQRHLTFTIDHDYTWVAAHELPERFGAYLR